MSFIGYDEGDSMLSSDNIFNFFIKRFKNINFGQTSISSKALEKKSKLVEDAIKNKHNFAKFSDSPRYCNHKHLAMFRLWMHGDCVKSICSKSVYYRIRGDIQELLGIDVSSPCVIDESNSKMIPIENLILDRMAVPSAEWEIYHP